MTKEMIEGTKYVPYKMFVGSMLPEWLERDTSLSFGAKACFARLMRYSGKDGSCFPSMRALGEALGVSERQAQRLVTELKGSGLVNAKQRGLGRSNSYTFLAHPLMSGALLLEGGILEVTPLEQPQGRTHQGGSDMDVPIEQPDAENIRESREENQSREQEERESREGVESSSLDLKGDDSLILSILHEDKESASPRLTRISEIILESDTHKTLTDNLIVRSQLEILFKMIGIKESVMSGYEYRDMMDQLSDQRKRLFNYTKQAISFLQ